ncbi:MAG TPA: hypothetical protein VGD38_00500, partial [Pyrinomonadaceae bacterium]
LGEGSHEFEVYFHFAPELELTVREAAVEARAGDAALTVRLLSHNQQPGLVNQHFSPNYGQLVDSVSACWRISGRPGKLSWKIFLTD